MPRHPVRLDAAAPSIVVPLVGRDGAELRRRAGSLREPVVDVVEWRVDQLAVFGGPDDLATAEAAVAAAVEALTLVRAELPDTPLLATLRSAAEGGAARIDRGGLVAVLSALVDTGEVDLLDLEFGGPAFADLLDLAHRAGTPVVASAHDFSATPPERAMIELLAGMEAAGADVCKLAVTPVDPGDVAALLAATATRFRAARRPLITVSMGPLGAVSRIGSGVFGSAATFAVVDGSSAPGQLPAAGVRAALDLLARG